MAFGPAHNYTVAIVDNSLLGPVQTFTFWSASMDSRATM